MKETNTLLKREELSATNNPYRAEQDPLVLKYGNQSLPLSVKRTRSGLSAYTGVWGEKQKIHLIRRTLFGVKKSDLDTLNGLTMEQAVDMLLNPAQPAIGEPVNYYENIYPDPTGVLLGDSWTLSLYGDNTVDYYRYLSFRAWWMRNILDQPMSVLQKMTLFWHNTFVTEYNVAGDSRLLFNYYSLLRTHALGNYKTFIKEISKNPMMLFYLNGHYNVKNSPDENYARELQELFTLGKGAGLWNEDDVKAAAKVLTGWRVDTNTVTSFFDPPRHETVNKQFSAFYNNAVITGQAGAAGANELDDLLNLIFANDQMVAKHLCRKIYRFFIYYDIDANIENNIISGMAQTLINNNWEILPVMSQLLKSDHFYDSLTMDCLIRTPFDYFLGMARTFGVQIPDIQTDIEEHHKACYTLASLCEQTGMNPANPPNVAGWQAYMQTPFYHQLWINSDTVPKRMRFTDQLISSNGIYVSANTRLKANVLNFVNTLDNPGDPDALIDQSVKYCLALNLSSNLKNNFKSILLGTGQTQNSYWTNAWNDYKNNPGNPTFEGIVSTRLRDFFTKLLRMSEHQLS